MAEVNKRAEALVKQWKAEKSASGSWYTHAEDIARVMSPRRLGFTSETVDGASRTEDIFDGTPMQAARGLANAVAGRLRPDGFVTVGVDDEEAKNDEEAQAWVETANEGLRSAFNTPKARMQQACGEVDLDLVTVADGILFIGMTEEQDSLLFQSIHPKDAVAVYTEEGAPEGMFRSRWFTVRQAVARFGLDKLHEDTRKLYTEQKQLDKKIEFLHAVTPRADGRADAMFATKFPYADTWIEVDKLHEAKIGGFHDFPYVVPRWDTSSGEKHGRSPGMIALPDANTAQAMAETLLIAGQRAADPALMVPNDGSFDAPNTYPGGLGYYDVETAASVGGNPFFSLEPGANISISRDMQSDTRDMIWAAFYRNILNLPIDGPQMTATEIMERKGELLREIGPVFGRLESDYTAPMVERAFRVMLRARQFPEVPEALLGKNIVFEYESPVKRLRKQIEAVAAQKWAQQIIQLSAETGREDLLDNVNFDGLADVTATADRVPGTVRNPQSVVDKIRADRQERQAAEMQAAQAQQMAEIADKSAGAMSKVGLVAEDQPQGEA
jgi:hypothetical protein